MSIAIVAPAHDLSRITYDCVVHLFQVIGHDGTDLGYATTYKEGDDYIRSWREEKAAEAAQEAA